MAAKAKSAGFEAAAEDLARYKTRALKDEKTLIFVASTHGEGDPPGSAAGFFEFLASRKAPSLKGVRFAVLGLGDSTYEFFCEAGKILDRRLEELGATRLLGRRDCDVGYEADAVQWLDHVLAKLQPSTPASGAAAGAGGAELLAKLLPGGVAGALGEAGRGTVHGKGNPFPAEITTSLRITGRDSSKDTRHLELSLEGSGLVHEPGDSLGIVPRNRQERVDELLGVLGWTGAERVKAGDRDLPVAHALRDAFEIAALTPRFIEQWGALSGNAGLAALAGKDRGEIAAFMRANQVVDVVKDSPASGIEPQAFVNALRGLQPRLYSIASSFDFAPDEAHLCIAPVRYQLNGSERGGVATLLLADALQPGDTVPVYVQRNDNFRLPREAATPIIMVGAGTGVAPYRAFMQHREAAGIEGRSWLFFGERNFRSDFLYQLEWQEWLRGGALSRLDLAFSRDGAAKVYVQHRLQEQAAELYRWIADGAHLYVCGDAAQMARDVHETLLAVIAAQAGRGREAAEEYLREMQADGRYQRDVY
jgi:sulfite reductase (NADPH) flavoprotein alpha-component